MNLLIFCGGIHGVGKTRFCSELATLLRATHVSAGTLMIDAPATTAKAVYDPVVNQAQILKEFETVRTAADRVVLDGHFWLIVPDRLVYRVPLGVFARICPTLMLVMTAAIPVISARLRVRDGIDVDEEFIRDLQFAEVEHARQVAAALRIPLKVIDLSHSVDTIAGWISQGVD